MSGWPFNKNAAGVVFGALISGIGFASPVTPNIAALGIVLIFLFAVDQICLTIKETAKAKEREGAE